MSYPKELELDDNNLWYLDDNKISKESIAFEGRKFDHEPRSKFYLIDGIDDYLIKVDEEWSFLHGFRTKNMLKQFEQRRELLSNVDLPIAYYQDKGKVKGMVLPYYQGGKSLRQILKFCLDDIANHYYHDENKKRNLLLLYRDILRLLWEMYDADMCYMDIHLGNFILYQNQVKVVDFEPYFIKFNHSNINKYLILSKYNRLVNAISFLNNEIELYLYSEKDFQDTDNQIKRLYKGC